MNDKKLLIITYYWPPNGGSGVQRWLKFVKYLPGLGWKPYVITPANSSFSISDDSLIKDIPTEAEVVKLPIWEPYDLFFKVAGVFGKKKMAQSDFLAARKKSLFQRLSTWIRGNFFIPDARIFWVGPTVKFLEHYIQEHQIKYIVTTGPPHSMHMIGLKLRKKNPLLHWIADFRDPWSEWDLLDSLSVSKLARARHRALERKVLMTADDVITISPFYVDRMKALGAKNVDLITNGFDETDFESITHIRTEKFTIRHVGNIDELRDPKPVMNAIRDLCVRNAEFHNAIFVEYIGHVNSGFKNFVNDDLVLSKITKFTDQIPHAALVKHYGDTDMQLLVLAHQALASGNIPGKVFEYLASGNPILALGASDGDVAKILNQTKAGEVFERDDQQGIGLFLMTCFDQWRKGAPLTGRDVSAFSRRKMTEQLVQILERH